MGSARAVYGNTMVVVRSGMDRKEMRKMVKMTQSFEHWLFTNHKDIFSLVLFGHTELVTEEMWVDYISWCSTEDGEQYLKGGSKYKEVEDEI